MNQISTAEWSRSQLILFRFFFCYFVFFLLFLNDIFPTQLFPFLDDVNAPFRFLRNSLFSWIGKSIILKDFDPYAFMGGDFYFAYVAVFTFLILSAFIALLWSVLDKRKSYNSLYKFLHTYGRYFLAYTLFIYGFAKLFGVQFRPLSPSSYMIPLSEWTPREFLWRFMGASRSYNFFGGLLEVIGGGLLLFRKTSTIGAIITLTILTNVLMLNIGYDVAVKLFTFHWILLSVFIMNKDVGQLYQLFVLHKQASLTIAPAIQINWPRWVIYGLKFSLIFYMVFFQIKTGIANRKEVLAKSSLYGIYNIVNYYKNNAPYSTLLTDTIIWKKFASYGGRSIIIQYTNDSLKSYQYKMDTAGKIFKLIDRSDSTSNINFSYSIINGSDYNFNGVYNEDSIRFILKSVDMNKFPIMKTRNKIRWIYE